MKTIDGINYLADDGKVFVRKSNNKIMGFGIGLGFKDSIDDFAEVDCPPEYKGIEGYDNTILEIELLLEAQEEQIKNE